MKEEQVRIGMEGTKVLIGEGLELKEVLTRKEMADCYFIRMKVFVLTQNVPIAEEIDGRDNFADHYLLLKDRRPVGTLRVTLEEGHYIHIGRVSVLLEEQGKGYGKKMMEAAMEIYHRRYPSYKFEIEAQVHARKFYEKLGFVCPDERVFLDSGIEHVMMYK